MTSYRDFVAYATARNPSLLALSSFLENRGRNLYASKIISMEVNTEGRSSDYAITNMKNLVAQIGNFQQQASQGRGGGLFIAIEDPGPNELNDVGAILDIDPFFLSGHLAVSYQAVERSPSSPIHALLPSRIVSAEYVNIHFQQVLDLGHEEDYGLLPYKSESQGNVSRSLRILPSLSQRRIGVARSCLSVLKKHLGDDAWICIILTDLPISQPGKNYPEPRKINVEDVVSLPRYSSFAGPAQRSFYPRSPSPAEDLLSILREQNITLRSDNNTPAVLDLAHYPIRIALTEWKLYVQLMSRYIKFFETRTARLEQRDVVELHRWRRRSTQSLHKIRTTRAFVDYWRRRNGGVGQKHDSWDLLDLDIAHIEMQIEQYASALESLNPIITSLIQLANSHRSLSEASDVRRLTYIAIVFIPLSFVAALFSMGDNFLPGSGGFWQYWATSVPITLGVLAAASLHRKAYFLGPYEKLQGWLLRRKRGK
ncbi:hypothetical protein F4801DRAFT_416888 [Xylaria longipes]|nr:hypothetical protein F4801DRAFT_416888 [Xylaria longipes]RYC59185.1 hypothetical protein CHU98_g7033 [Xylaria longipes]